MCTSPTRSAGFINSVSLCPDSIGTKFSGKLGSKPGGKKPFKPYNNAERKNRPGKAGDGGKNPHKPAFSKAGKGSQKRKLPPFKAKREEEGGDGEKTSCHTHCVVLYDLLCGDIPTSCVYGQVQRLRR